jgi:hypothetical protein
MGSCRPEVLNALIGIAGTLSPTDTTLLAAKDLPGGPKAVALGELLAFTRATGREAGIWWDPVRQRNIIGLGNSEPFLTSRGRRAWKTPTPLESCILVAHTHPHDSPPSDNDFIALAVGNRRAVAALKGWPRYPGPVSFESFKSLLLPLGGDPVIFRVNRPDTPSHRR